MPFSRLLQLADPVFRSPADDVRTYGKFRRQAAEKMQVCLCRNAAPAAKLYIRTWEGYAMYGKVT